VDNYRNPNHPVAAWLFRPEYKPEVSKNRGVDPHADRYRRHTHRIAFPWNCVNISLTWSKYLLLPAGNLPKEKTYERK
jgi:hypothetical protein